MQKDITFVRLAMRITTMLLATTLTISAHAQTTEPQPDALDTYLESAGPCFQDYRFGSVQFSFPEDEPQLKGKAGELLSVTGTVTNTNEYPIPQGTILARVLRQDNAVAPDHWHPVVGEFTLPDDYSLNTQGSRPFTFSWNISSKARSGMYRVEFFFLAGSHYIFSGIPYVANVSGGSTLISIDGTSEASVVFDRSSVTLQGDPLALRSVPPILSLNAHVLVTAKLGATGAEHIPVTLHTALYEWADTDGKPPIIETTENLSVSTSEPISIPFTWDKPQSGTYHLVFTATPTDANLLPSILKVRFSVQGSVPRIVYSGIGGFTDTEAVITTCVINGTVGQGSSSIQTKVMSGGTILGESSGAIGEALSSMSVRVPRDVFASPVDIETQARGANGEIVDQQTLSFTPELFETSSIKETFLQKNMRTVVALVALIAMGALVYVYKKQFAV